jgi:plasmid stabilization system protein ParE
VKVFWSPLAERRAIEAYEAIAQDRPKPALSWLRALISKVGELRRFANRGRAVPEIAKPAYRQMLHHPYRVIYRVDAKRVTVLTIRHLRRDWHASDLELGE